MVGEKNNIRIDYSKSKWKKSKRIKPTNSSCLNIPRDASKVHTNYSKNKDCYQPNIPLRCWYMISGNMVIYMRIYRSWFPCLQLKGKTSSDIMQLILRRNERKYKPANVIYKDKMLATPKQSIPNFDWISDNPQDRRVPQRPHKILELIWLELPCSGV